MLEPSDRQVYWEPLSPPPGYELDMAIATTYSLDLQALIMAAVPMAFGALDVEQEGLPDQVQALASLQRVARRVTVFCQQAQIVPPGKYSRLFGLLEPVVAEVRAPRGGVFHPKMWLTRYTAEGRDPRYRLVVLSRNLTLDRSWDAMFVADGSPGHTARGYRQPLSDFIRTLPDLCVEPLADTRRSEIRALSRELDDVYFPRLEGFSQMRHGPIGIRGYSSLPSGRADRRLVISPFLADHTVTELLADVGEGILVSRADALDRLEEDTLAALDHCRIHYWLDDVADEPSGDEAEEATPGYEPEAGETLHGLHAKIIVSEQGHLSRMLIGSANATDAAFGNHNVEYCLQFTARNEDFSIESIIPPEPDEDDPAGRGVLNMLMPYQRDEHFTPPPPDLTEDALRDMREQLVALDLGLAVRSVGEDTWDKGDMGVRCRYALRFGDLRSEDRTVARRGDVRQAFNSPFRPFILATTSIGQEGLDFHLYCHSVCHWNLPSNPVDLEQREGRVNRYKCHAIRRSVARDLGLSSLGGRNGDPWQALFAAAEANRGDDRTELVPWWVYDGPDSVKIERIVPMLPLSRETQRLPALKEALAAYRLVFGQPRQDDLLEYILDRLDEEEIDREALRQCQIDLSPR